MEDVNKEMKILQVLQELYGEELFNFRRLNKAKDEILKKVELSESRIKAIELLMTTTKLD